MKIQSIKRIEPELSRCISVDSADKLFAIKSKGESDKKGANLLTHNSVLQQNIIFSCLLRPEHWTIIGIDLKRVELTRFREFGMKVATEVEDAVQFMRFAQAVMMKRYEKMEGEGVNDFVDLKVPGTALMIMIDEAGELLSQSGVKTDEGKAEDELKGEVQMILGSIARLGRAAGVHLLIATQRPDATLIPGETRDNLAVRIGCGPLKPNASTMLFDSGIGRRIHSNPKGGIYVQIHGKGNMGQGFYAPNDWLREYYKRHNINPDGKTDNISTELTESKGKRTHEDPIASWDDDMDELMELGE